MHLRAHDRPTRSGLKPQTPSAASSAQARGGSPCPPGALRSRVGLVTQVCLLTRVCLLSAALGAGQGFAQSPAPPAAPGLSSTPPPARTLHVLGIGIDHYQDPAIPPFPNAQAEVQAILEALEQQRGKVFSVVRGQTLLGEAATTEAMRAQLQAFCADAALEDACIVVLKTRAWHDRALGSNTFLGVNTRLQALKGSAIPHADVLDALLSKGAGPARPPMLILAETGDRAELEPVELVWPDAPPPSLAQLTAGSRPTDATTQSVFTRALLQALTTPQADASGDGLVSLLELATAVGQQVKADSQGSQLPELSGALPREQLELWAPAQVERCNQVDDDGDGQIDEDFDLDHDGFYARARCSPRFGNDCDDQNAKLHPAQPDPGNFLDDDCDGVLDEDDPDLNHNGIPDSWESRSQELRMRTLAAVGATAALAGTGLFAWSRVQALREEASTQGDIRPWIEPLQQWSTLSVMAGGGCLVGLSVSGVYGVLGQAFDVRYLKKKGFMPEQKVPR